MVDVVQLAHHVELFGCSMYAMHSISRPDFSAMTLMFKALSVPSTVNAACNF